MKTIAVLTSGGDAPGMNAAVRAVVRTACENGIKVYGVIRGYNGLINGDFIEMDLRSVSDIINRGGTILYSARSVEFATEEGMRKAIRTCQEYGIEGVVVIGGDGSFRGARDLSERGIPCVGIPGTIDNDIACCDYTIGYDTCLNTIMEMVDRVELGFSSDMGVTNSRYPEEICEGQMQMDQGSMMGLAYDKLDVSTEDMEDVDLYLHSLGVPARRNVNDPNVIKGEQKFYEAKCHLCHVTTLHTRTRGATLLNGTELPWLGGQTIHPYSDFLLHDMGSEIMGVGLNDNYVSGLARGNEWRTTPLWGIGLQEKVNGHTYFLHDGRARNLIEAIMWHGGEAEASKNLFKNMSKEDRNALIDFINSL